MALQTSPPISLQDLINEVDEGSLLLTSDSLLDFAGLFSGGTPVDLLDYLGADQPTGINTGVASNIDSPNYQADFSATVTSPGGGAARTDTKCQVAIEYDTVSSFSSSSRTSFKTFNNGGSAVTWTNVTLSGQGTTTIYYRAVAYNEFNNETSLRVGNTRSLTFCQPPRSPSAAEVFGGSIQITWTDPTTGNPSNGYDIQYSKNGGGWSYLTSPGSTANSYTHNGCSRDYVNGDTLVYRIRAKCGSSNSGWVQSNGITPSGC